MKPDDLYGLPLEQFTEQRNALAKQLRGAGQRDDAAGVSKLRKPSVAAWAVNQLVRTQRRDIDALFKAGDALQKAQADLLAKRGDPAALREAADAERAALDRLTAAARGLLSADGHELTPARLEQVSESLHAAALDEDARSQVRGGRLVRELRHVGLGALGPVDAPEPRASRRPPRAAKRGRVADDRAAELKAARQAEANARRRADRAARELEAAEQRRDRATERLREAEEALAAAREQAGQTAKALGKAERAVGKLER
jgi:hypothetical protein